MFDINRGQEGLSKISLIGQSIIRSDVMRIEKVTIFFILISWSFLQILSV